MVPDSVAVAGTGVLPGAIWRGGDPVKHLGPREGLMPLWARTFQTRCGLEAGDGPWSYTTPNQNDDVWCPACLAQGGVPHRVEPWDRSAGSEPDAPGAAHIRPDGVEDS